MKTFSLTSHLPHSQINRLFHSFFVFGLCLVMPQYAPYLLIAYTVFRLQGKTWIKPLLAENHRVEYSSELYIHFFAIIEQILAFSAFWSALNASGSWILKSFVLLTAFVFFLVFGGKLESYHYISHRSVTMKYLASMLSAILHGHGACWLKHVNVHHPYFGTKRDKQSAFLTHNVYFFALKVFVDSLAPSKGVPMGATILLNLLSLASVALAYLFLGGMGLMLWLLVSYAVMLGGTVPGTIHHFGIYRSRRLGRHAHYSTDNEKAHAAPGEEAFVEDFHSHHHILSGELIQSTVANPFVSPLSIDYELAGKYLLFSPQKYLRLNHKNFMRFASELATREELMLMKVDLLQIERKHKKRKKGYWPETLPDILSLVDRRLSAHPHLQAGMNSN